MEGIGETIRPLEKHEQPPTSQFVVVKPEAGLETKAIFSSKLLKRDSDHATISGFAAAHYDFGRNDLQPVAESLYPEVKKVINWLKSKGLHARMTGSGSAVFAQMPNEVNFQDAPSAWKIKTCGNLMIHPLAGWVAESN